MRSNTQIETTCHSFMFHVSLLKVKLFNFSENCVAELYLLYRLVCVDMLYISRRPQCPEMDGRQRLQREGH